MLIEIEFLVLWYYILMNLLVFISKKNEKLWN